jgi:large subunit ribosomal protein L25
MKNEITLQAAIRKQTGTSAVKRLRKAGRVVGVLYGKKTSPLPLELPAPAITKLLRDTGDEHLLINLNIEGSDKPTRLALVQDVQHDPLSGNVLHVDFHEVAADEKIRISVHIVTQGEPVGVKTGGGILETVLREVTVECLPADLPHNITLDVSQLNIGQAIHIGDIKPPQGVTILGNPNAVVVTVAAPTVATAEETTPQAQTEPEVASGKGKKPAEGEAKTEAKK